MNKLLNAMIADNNYTTTENGGLAYRSTLNAVYDMFAFGGAMRKRSNTDIILTFKKAYEENPFYAVRCLFYLRDVRGGQGERNFFRVCMRWLANEYPNVALTLIQHIAEYGRWDDLYIFVGTPIEEQMFCHMYKQFLLDLDSKTPSLLGKWLKSENTSSKESRKLGKKTRLAFGLTSKKYRKCLSELRTRINIVEKLMSENRWDEIEFDKIPSKAGLKYKNAFARREVERYRAFAQSKTTTVNAGTLYPYEVVENGLKCMGTDIDDTNRLIANKYWDNLTDYFNGASFNALCVVDTSASMRGTPLNVAISLGMYCAERGKGPFANHYIAFSRAPRLVAIEGVDFVDKISRIYRANLCENTNIEATFNMILDTLIKNKCSKEDLPQNLIIISDMEFDFQRDDYSTEIGTLMDKMAQKWLEHGYILPHLIYWNVDARQNNIPMLGNGPISYVSGFSPSIFQTIMTGKTGYDLMMEVLNKERYAVIA
jgi:hypothetical protein